MTQASFALAESLAYLGAVNLDILRFFFSFGSGDEPALLYPFVCIYLKKLSLMHIRGGRIKQKHEREGKAELLLCS